MVTNQFLFFSLFTGSFRPSKVFLTRFFWTSKWGPPDPFSSTPDHPKALQPSESVVLFMGETTGCPFPPINPKIKQLAAVFFLGLFRLWQMFLRHGLPSPHFPPLKSGLQLLLFPERKAQILISHFIFRRQGSLSSDQNLLLLHFSLISMATVQKTTFEWWWSDNFFFYSEEISCV